MSHNIFPKGKPRCLFIFALSIIAFQVTGQIDFSYQSSYYYLKGKDAANLSDNWMDKDYDYSGWLSGNAPFRYGDGVSGVELTDMQDSYSTVYLRSTFECFNNEMIEEIVFSVDYDDGFIIWINGEEALRRNVPQVLSYNAFAPNNHESGIAEEYIVNTVSLNLTEGMNEIAVQGFNVSLSSSDFYFDMTVKAEKNIPELSDSVGISVSVPSGFFYDPFYVTLDSPYDDALIIYTLDGSNPQYSDRAFLAGSTVSVIIDPSDTTGRDITPGVVLRASVTKEGYRPSKPVSRTYIFTEKVKSQSWPGGEWPDYDVNGQIIDLDMDLQLINDPEYSGLIDEALFDIPTISIITDIENLFDPFSGIYVNAYGHGQNWEKECSAELIQPDGSQGFNVNAGLRIRGGWSRHDDYPKHSFRLFFREEYGNKKLYYPLFGQEGATVFDKIDLRTAQNYAWSNGYPYNSFVREVFSRDTQRDMDQPYTRSRYYHLYLNGMYWGLYQTQERSEARFASTYFGDDEDDYDVIKVDMENYTYSIEATDGGLASWERLWELCGEGFSENSNYYLLEGKDEKGNPVRGGEIMVDIDNLIDYMMVVFYTGNFDAPTSSFFNNKKCNNFYAIDNREERQTGFTFYAHDSEHSLFDEPHSPGIGLYENRVNLADRDDNLKMEVSDFSFFHPQWLHYKLSFNIEYRDRFASRAYNHFQPGGVFTTDSSLRRLNNRIEEIESAIIAESARWGDSKSVSGDPYTRNNNWLPEVNKIRNRFIPLRNNIVIGQLRAADLYPKVEAPLLMVNGSIVSETEFHADKPVTMNITNPSSRGTIYYTLNGEDPRDHGGKINRLVLFCNNYTDLTFTESATLKTRIFNDGNWSALRELNIIMDQDDYSDLKVTELHYHPPDYFNGTDTISGKDLEFIEFKNKGVNAINLSGVILDSAVYYQFPENSLLSPGRFIVLASKPTRFYDYYGLVASGNYRGNFSNGGEEVLLTDRKGDEILHFIYEDSYPWPDGADGEGFSMSSVETDPISSPEDYVYWTTSVNYAGNPFADNITNEEEGYQSNDRIEVFAYPNPSFGILSIRVNSEEETSILDIDLYNNIGKKICHERIGNPGLLDLSYLDLPTGTYVMRINTGNHTVQKTIILVKQ